MPILSIELCEVPVLRSCHQEVDILESCGRFCHSFYFSIDETTFEIKDVLQLIWVFESKCVLHQHDVNSLHASSFDCEHAEFLRQETVWHILVVLSQTGKQSQEKIQFGLGHCLNDELLVMAEEKEASTATSSLSCLEHHIAIVFGAETLMQDLETLEVVFESAHECAHSIVGHFDACANDQSVIWLRWL